MTDRDSLMFEGLKNAANTLVTEAKKLAQSSRIKDALSVGDTEKLTEASWAVKIEVDLNKAPFAVAWEYGSGLHGKKKEKYEINPKNSPALAFIWEAMIDPVFSGVNKNKLITFNPRTGFVKLKWVEHPGVEAKPYMHPAFENKEDEMKREIIESAQQAFTSDIRLKLLEVFVSK